MLNNFLWKPLAVVAAVLGVWSGVFWYGSAKFQDLALTHPKVASALSAWSSNWNVLAAGFAVAGAVLAALLTLVALTNAE